MRKIFYVLPLIVLALSSCMKGDDNPTPLAVPNGTYTGQFRTLHRNNKGGFDTTQKATLQLAISTATGYKITGDTATIHAGSYGDFAMDPNYIQFIDKTYPKTGTPTKVHLSGTYQYYYDGVSVFQLQQASADTLYYQYDLKKQ